MVGLMDDYKLSRAQGVNPGAATLWPGPALPTPLPPDPPPTPPSSCTRFPDIPEDIWKTGAGRRRRGEGLGAQHCAGLGLGGFPPRLYPAHLGQVALGGAEGGGKP